MIMDDIYHNPDKIPKIDAETLRRLSTLKPWRSFLAMGLDWIIIVLCIVVCETFGYWFYPLAFVVVGSRFHGLEAMMHEATHYRLHPSKKINEFIGEISVWPLGLSLFVYRNLRHFAHHRNIGTSGDSHISQSYQKHAARFDIPKSFPKLLVSCLSVGIRFPAEVWLGQLYSTARLLPRISKRLGVLWFGFQLMIIATVVTGSIIYGPKVAAIYFLFFVLPLFWVALFSRYLRLLAEHFGIPAGPPDSIRGSETRTVIVSRPLQILFWPHNLNYHTEHHWYPSVPFYNLPALHAELKKSPHAQKSMHITRGLSNLMHELATH